MLIVALLFVLFSPLVCGSRYHAVASFDSVLVAALWIVGFPSSQRKQTNSTPTPLHKQATALARRPTRFVLHPVKLQTSAKMMFSTVAIAAFAGLAAAAPVKRGFGGRATYYATGKSRLMAHLSSAIAHHYRSTRSRCMRTNV